MVTGYFDRRGLFRVKYNSVRCREKYGRDCEKKELVALFC
jgi:hypothetical protein